MGTNYNPQIVTSGLVLALDSANPKSYPGSGTTWTDLSGQNNTGTLVNSPTYNSANGTLTFTGTQRADTAKISTITEGTFLAWIKRKGIQVDYTGILFGRYYGLATGMGFTSSQNLGYTWNDAFNTYSWISGLVIPDSQWCMVAITVNSTSGTAYLCQSSGITTAVNTVSHGSVSGFNLVVGYDSASSSRAFIGDIGPVMFYNRAFTANEIQQNFNAGRGRYNL
jgi:hypothetical protein